ncbi:hypothetical protein J422_03438 [Methanocaldococcus villosus KIN24-T80]|uniref:Uncharacterized protein n=1 Tax=Methanocaldococcus villosus KIN24-T80 TaxID=1069083 RepID=N6VQR4_9EURY|nr:hypothetical protein [Methanocaldococcus villosus]ENN96240.1 hypothetical protein J422_03438 [Methanocaldococcus villosus KIN24-T80]
MQIYFWSKSATKPQNKMEDKLYFNEVTTDEGGGILDLIQALEKKIGNWRDFNNDVDPENASVKKWIKKILESYPDRSDDEVEYLIDTFRAALNTKSKEADKFLIGVLQMENILVIVHCRKDPSLAEIKDKLYAVRVLLHPKNIIRADIIKKDGENIILGAFEYSRRMSKGHAKFWGIEPEDVGWESIGTIRLNVELEEFDFPIQIPIEQDDLKNLIDKGIISPTGRIKIGRSEGKVTKVFVHNKAYEYKMFYDMFVALTERLTEYRRRFEKLIPTQQKISMYFSNDRKYQYMEDEKAVYSFTQDREELKFKKEHPKYIVCFFTKSTPGIEPKHSFLLKLYQSIFEDTRELEIFHAGEEISLEPFKIGGLKIYNQVDISEDVVKFSENLMKQIKDTQSRKGKVLLEYLFCKVYSENIRNPHLKSLFEFIIENIIKAEIEYEFRNSGILQAENILEFKSADDVLGNPSKFVKKKLVPTIKKYLDGEVQRHCIIYGIEDNFDIKPIYHLKNDQITWMEKKANEELNEENVKIHILPIPYNNGLILAVYMIPIYG